MSESCSHWVEAEIRSVLNEDGSTIVVEWVEAPDQIHVSEDLLLLHKQVNRALMREGYEVQEACPRLAEVRHVRKSAA